MENIKHELNENIQFEETILVTGREAIENQLFRIAKEQSALASQDVDRNDVPKMQTEMKHSIIAIVMSFTALEALSNDIYYRLTRKDFDSKEFKKFDYNERGFIGKWERLAELAFLANKPDDVFAPSDNFEDLLKSLKNLRDQIVHYKPKPENIERLRRTPDNHVVSSELETFTAEEATKAIQTVRTLLETFEKTTGYKVPKLD